MREFYVMSIELPGGKVEPIVSLSLKEALSDRTIASVGFTSTDDLDFEPMLAQPVTIILKLADQELRRWTLKLDNAQWVENDTPRFNSFEVELRDALWFLEFGSSLRKYRNMSAADIVTKVLTENGVKHRWELTKNPPVRKFCSQYRETHLAFVERLLESEGIFYHFEQDGTMVMGDSSKSGPALPAKADLELREVTGGNRDEYDISRIRKRCRVMTGSVTLGDFNWKKPDMVLRSSAASSKDTILERYSYPAGFREPNQGTTMAQRQIEAERAKSVVFQGIAVHPFMAPGFFFRFGTEGGGMYSGEHLIVEMTHSFTQTPPADYDQQAPAQLAQEFVTIPRAVPFRPALKTPRPTVRGTHTVMVRGPAGEEIHTDKYGRFRAQFHWDREAVGTDDDSRWLRLLQESASGQVLARVGWEVYAAYIDGDPDRPIGIGRAINGQMVPTYSQPSNKNTMTMQTPSSPATGGFNELRMNDTAGSEQIYMRAEKNLDVLVKNDKSEITDNNETHFVGVNFGRQVMLDQTILIGGNAFNEYKNNHQLQVQANRTKTVMGNETVKVDGAQSISIAEANAEAVGGNRISIVGAIKPPDFKAMAKDAAKTFVQEAFPEATQAVNTVKEIQSNVENYVNTLQTVASDPGAYLEGKASELQGALQSGINQGITDGGRALFDGKGGDAAGNAFGSAVETSVTDSFNGIVNELNPQQIIPTQDQLNSLVPTEDWLPDDEELAVASEKALSKLTGGLSDGVTADKIINLLCSGEIQRSPGTVLTKTVGAAYITVAVLGIDTNIKYAMAETIGGAKITVALKEINTTVDGVMLQTVGGLIMRASKLPISIVTNKNSSIKVGAKAQYTAEEKMEIHGATVKMTFATSGLAQGGDAMIEMKPGSLKLAGKLNLKASGNISITGSPLNITKA